MEGFPFSPYTADAVCAAPVPDSGWAKRQGRFLAPPGHNYLELCKAIIAQVNTGASAPLRRAHTKECGVQVNAKVDKVVQCSLGPKTLFCQEEDEDVEEDENEEQGDHQDYPKSPREFADACVKTLCSTPTTPQLDSLRFLRPVSIYSPAFDRRAKKRDDVQEPELDGGNESDEGREDGDQVFTTPHRTQRGSRFQFLEQRYGFFHCKQCSIRWESAYVWCISGTSKVYYKQLCRKCQLGFNPYRVESILCKGCSQTSCVCEKKQRHINMKKPHRQDLCCRCKGMKLSCDATYSFKYIV